MIWLVLSVTVAAAAIDLWKREIPDSLSILLIIAGIASWWWPGEDPWSRRVVLAVTGALLAGTATGILYAVNGLGGGDVKLLTAIGFCLGPVIGYVMLWTALAGAILAVVASLRRQKEYAYAPAIFIGVATQAFFPGLLARFSDAV